MKEIDSRRRWMEMVDYFEIICIFVYRQPVIRKINRHFENGHKDIVITFHAKNF